MANINLPVWTFWDTLLHLLLHNPCYIDPQRTKLELKNQTKSRSLLFFSFRFCLLSILLFFLFHRLTALSHMSFNLVSFYFSEKKKFSLFFFSRRDLHLYCHVEGSLSKYDLCIGRGGMLCQLFVTKSTMETNPF